MNTTLAKNLYEQARDLGWDRARAAHIAGVSVETAEIWEAKWDAVVTRIIERSASPPTLRRRTGPTFIGNPTSIPLGDGEGV